MMVGLDIKLGSVFKVIVDFTIEGIASWLVSLISCGREIFLTESPTILLTSLLLDASEIRPLVSECDLALYC